MRRRHLLASPALALGLTVAPSLAAPAAAAPPVPVAGNYTTVLTSGTPAEGQGNAQFFKFSNAVAISGGITASGTASYRCLLLAEKFLSCKGEQILDDVVQVAGVQGEGTLTNRVVFRVDLTTGQLSGTSVIRSGTGAWADIHGVIRSEAIFGQPGGTYTGQVVLPRWPRARWSDRT